ncbi:ankyrin repeat domain-containing protein SOWAHA [Scleropages formosus]|uniref:ankyrin repeat domain-containing protein SOWAHA n=1 Tax=Scleropages formosus TaxID=113540 RepID=UPI0008791A6D|nr:ankyrin repeat domain-containing protein SOWAHA [Scleropages formosus]
MAFTQEHVLNFLLDRGGRAKNSELLNSFKERINCDDPAKRKQNRELFKTFVNNVAVVKDIEGAKYVVIKKKYEHLISGKVDSRAQQREQKKNAEAPESLCSPGYDLEGRGHEKGKTLKPDIDHHLPAPSVKSDSSNISSRNTATGFPLQTDRAGDLTPKNAQTHKEDRLPKYTREEPSVAQDCSPSGEERTGKTRPAFPLAAVKSQLEMQSGQLHIKQEKLQPMMPKAEIQKTTQKPCALPLRFPLPEIKIEVVDSLPKNNDLSKDTTNHDIERSPRTKRRQLEGIAGSSSPQLRRAFKTTKPGEELKFPDTIPLEPAEHEWLVRSAAGHWSQVHGLVLQDSLLAKKKDFMSGFTALHWAAKSGNNDMVCKIIEIAKRGGIKVDVNTKSYGGYTPLHIAAIHNQKSVMMLLVQDFAANVHVRDNSGKKPYHYLPVEASPDLRQLLGGPVIPHQGTFKEKLEEDLLPELPKGFNTLSRLFQPHGGHRRKHKSLTGLYSLTEDMEEESAVRRIRPVSDVFF